MSTGADNAPGHVPLIRVQLDPASVEAVARRIVELLDEAREDQKPAQAPEFIDTAEVARRLGVKPAYVYNHAEELGALRLGDGPKPRLRFDPAIVAKELTHCSCSRESEIVEEPMPKRNTPRRQRSRLGAEHNLLPITPREVV